MYLKFYLINQIIFWKYMLFELLGEGQQKTRKEKHFGTLIVNRVIGNR